MCLLLRLLQILAQEANHRLHWIGSALSNHKHDLLCHVLCELVQGEVGRRFAHLQVLAFQDVAAHRSIPRARRVVHRCAWASSIRMKRHIGNFTRWKDHDAYQLAFERLLRDLKAASPQAHWQKYRLKGLSSRKHCDKLPLCWALSISTSASSTPSTVPCCSATQPTPRSPALAGRKQSPR